MSPLTEEQNKMKYETKCKTKFYIWSDIGHTPLTNRGSYYCDLLLEQTELCKSPHEASIVLDELLQKTEHAHKGYFEMIGYWNQNTRYNYAIKKARINL